MHDAQVKSNTGVFTEVMGFSTSSTRHEGATANELALSASGETATTVRRRQHRKEQHGEIIATTLENLEAKLKGSTCP
jgi:hypothetical protein